MSASYQRSGCDDIIPFRMEWIARPYVAGATSRLLSMKIMGCTILLPVPGTPRSCFARRGHHGAAFSPFGGSTLTQRRQDHADSPQVAHRRRDSGIVGRLLGGGTDIGRDCLAPFSNSKTPAARSSSHPTASSAPWSSAARGEDLATQAGFGPSAVLWLIVC